MRLEYVGAMPSPIRPKPSAHVGSPLVSCRQVSPPSVDLYNPLPGPSYAPLVVHGGRRDAHMSAYRVCGLDGSNARSIAPVFSSLYRIFFQVRPPSTVRNTPRSAFGP